MSETAGTTKTVDPLDAAIEEFENAPPPEEVEEEQSGVAAEESTSEEGEEEEVELEASEEEGEETEEQTTATEVKRSPLFKKVLEKYGGDEEKLADALVHQWNSSSELHKRTQQLERELEELKASKPEEPTEPPPEVVEVQAEIESLNAEAGDNQKSMETLLKEMDGLNRDIYRIQGKKENAEDFDKQQLESQEEAKKRELRGIVSEYRGLEKSNARLQREYNKQQRKLENANKQAEASRVKQRKEEVDRAQVRVDASTGFAEAMTAAQAKYGFTNPTRMEKLIRKEVLDYIESLPEDSDPIDVAAYTSKVADEIAEEMGAVANKKFVAASKTKAGTVPKGRPRTDGSPTPKSKYAKTGAEARAHAERILGQ